LITWGVDNSQRLDIQFDRNADRDGKPQLLQLLPYGEISFDRWNTDPYDSTPDGSGTSASDPGYFTFPYWLSKWVGLLSDA